MDIVWTDIIVRPQVAYGNHILSFFSFLFSAPPLYFFIFGVVLSLASLVPRGYIIFGLRTFFLILFFVFFPPLRLASWYGFITRVRIITFLLLVHFRYGRAFQKPTTGQHQEKKDFLVSLPCHHVFFFLFFFFLARGNLLSSLRFSSTLLRSSI